MNRLDISLTEDQIQRLKDLLSRRIERNLDLITWHNDPYIETNQEIKAQFEKQAEIRKIKIAFDRRILTELAKAKS